MQLDIRGLEISTRSAAAATHLDRAVSDFLDYGQTACAQVKSALEADPGCPLALCYRSYLMMMLETRAVYPKIQQGLEALYAAREQMTRWCDP